MESNPNHPPPPPIQRSTFEWNTILRRAKPTQSLSIYLHSLLPSLSLPNKFTFTFLLKSLTHHPHTRHLLPHLHAHIIKFSLHSDPFLISSLISAYSLLNQISTVNLLFSHSPFKDTAVHTALVSAYARFGLPDSAQLAFDRIPNPNPISWAALIAAYARTDRHGNALSAFRRMLRADVGPTEAALVSVLAASTSLCDINRGRMLHKLIVVYTLGPTLAIGTALLNMYAKCGLVEDSLKVFDEIRDRDQATWTTMISAMAAHGRGVEALRLFDEMLLTGVAPDHVTYVSVLHACSHGALVDEAKRHFKEMRKIYGIEARMEHYGCMVDVLCRGGRVKEAWEMVRLMPMEPDKYALKSLLSACCGCGFLEWAEWAADKLRKIDAGHASSYVMLSNAYASIGRWEDSARVRRLMRDRGVPKTSGSSAIC